MMIDFMERTVGISKQNLLVKMKILIVIQTHPDRIQPTKHQFDLEIVLSIP